MQLIEMRSRKHIPRFVGTGLAVTLLITLAACAPATPTPDARIVPTLAAPGWIESAAPITAANVAQVAYLGRLDAPETMSTSFAHTLSPDSTRLVVLNNEELLGFDLLTGALIFRTGRSDAVSAFYSPDKTEVYAISGTGVLTIYDAEAGGMKNTLLLGDGGGFSVTVTYDSGNGWLAAGSLTGTISVWDTAARARITEIRIESQATEGVLPVTSLTFSADGTRLAAAYGDATVRVWQADAALGWGSPTQPAALPLVDTRPGALAFSPQGDQLAIGTDIDARLWPYSTDAEVRRLDAGAGAVSVAFAPAGDRLITGSERGFTAWDASAVRSIGQLPATQGITSSAAFSPDGALLLTSILNVLPDVAPVEGAPANRVSLWSVADAGAAGIGEAVLPVDTAIARVDWTDDGRLLLLFSANGPIYVWGIASLAVAR